MQEFETRQGRVDQRRISALVRFSHRETQARTNPVTAREDGILHRRCETARAARAGRPAERRLDGTFDPTIRVHLRLAHV